jgi:hypothetical protein
VTAQTVKLHNEHQLLEDTDVEIYAIYRIIAAIQA